MIALVGNPNVGKTLLFNQLTGASDRVGNWHGVTVDKSEREVTYQGDKYTFVDLPGCYNLKGYSLEEIKTAQSLSPYQKVINICNLIHLERNLYLTLLLIEKGYNVVLFINKFGKDKVSLDTDALSRYLGLKVVMQNAKNVKLQDLLEGYKVGRLDYLDYNFSQKPEEEKALIRYKYIERLLQKCGYNIESKPSMIDKLFVNKYLAIPMFCLIFACIFFVCFGPLGKALCDGFSALLTSSILTPISNFLKAYLVSEFVYSLVVEGILSALLGLLSFLPQIALVSFFLNMLEDSGYLSRIAFLFEGLLNKIGLSGKSIFSLLLSLGCNTTAVLSTSSQETKESKIKLCLLLPFVPCSAKLPIFVIFTKLIVDSLGLLFIIGLYVGSIVVGFLTLYIINKFSKTQKANLLLEVPVLIKPSLTKATKEAIKAGKSFVIKIGTTIFITNLFVWFLQNFDFSFRFRGGESILEGICGFLLPLFKPLGLGDVGVVSALIIGAMAKELIVTTLATVNNIAVTDFSLLLIGEGAIFSPLTIVVFLVFVCLYSPCISTLSAINKSVGKKYAVYSFLLNTLVAYVVSMLVYFCGKVMSIGVFVLFIVIICLILALFGAKRCGECIKCKNKNCSKYVK